MKLQAGEVNVSAATTNCSSDGGTDAKVQVDLSDRVIRCNCSVPRPRAAISGSVHLLPNSIDFDSVFSNPDSLSKNDIVFYTVIGEWALYILMIIIFNVDFQQLREKMSGGSPTVKRKRQLPQLSVLPPDRMPAPYLYQITVTTGSMFAAGSSARIGFQVFGSMCKSAVKSINPGGESLLRGGSYDIIMPMKTSLGHLELLHIWHDNTGVDEASWFLRDIIVKDLQTDEM
ncbi:PKDREJ [Branchiostoma lanceolatum]|uniref:PKDREJ protein n=1 Tax=Branchiostoma lanceolatum TaxID=7740 RepID=A0A8J9YZC5_BRALA|nr:PKDREJ [Branchiostoma lanceolatum]